MWLTSLGPRRKQLTGPSWLELGFSTDPITLSCYNEDIAWLKHSQSQGLSKARLTGQLPPKIAGTLRQPALGHAQ